jgi:ABC-type Fe3+ transport system substrate-binding protein
MYGIPGDTRGQQLFYAMAQSMITNGKVQGTDYTDPAADTAGLKWFKDNIEPNVLQFADIDVMRTKMQSARLGVALSWNSYIRGILSSDWKPVTRSPSRGIPPPGRPAIARTLRVAKGTKHPVAARVLINWMIGP